MGALERTNDLWSNYLWPFCVVVTLKTHLSASSLIVFQGLFFVPGLATPTAVKYLSPFMEILSKKTKAWF